MKNFTAVKERELVVGQQVEVYYNLHKHVFSIRDKKTKLVYAHAMSVHLRNVTFKVNKKGRENVIKSKQKNVHAFLVGEFVGLDSPFSSQETNDIRSAYYNPYVVDCFIDLATKKPLSLEETVYCENKKIYYV